MLGEHHLLTLLMWLPTDQYCSDGHYGLWVDSSLEKGVSAHCQTFGNEPLSDEGVKFDILGIEVWYVGS